MCILDKGTIKVYNNSRKQYAANSERWGLYMLINEMKRKYTSDEFLAMTDIEGRYELVSGEIYAMSPAPNIKHQILSKKTA